MVDFNPLPQALLSLLPENGGEEVLSVRSSAKLDKAWVSASDPRGRGGGASGSKLSDQDPPPFAKTVKNIHVPRKYDDSWGSAFCAPLVHLLLSVQDVYMPVNYIPC